MNAPLPPPGIGLRVDRGLRRVGAGKVLIGGSPMRIIRLSNTGSGVVDAWIEGRPLADIISARKLARRLLDAGMLHPVVGALDSPPPLTVVVPAHDDAANLDRLLATVDSPAVVVDDGSQDPAAIAAIAAVAQRHGARLVRRETNAGPGAARMSGLPVVTTDLVAFVDCDVTLPPNWWASLAAHFADEAVVAVAPRVTSRPGPSLRERYESVHSPLDLGPEPGRVGPGRAIAYVPTAAIVMKVEAVEAVGGFDPNLRVGEDVDLIWRIVEAGGTVRYAPEVEVQHRPRATWWRMAAQRRSYGRSAVDLAACHGSIVAPARCSRWSFAAWMAALLGHPGVGAAVAVASSLALIPKLRDVPDASREALRIAGWGQLQAGRGLAVAVSRVWWPILIPAAAVWRRVRPGVALAMVGPALWSWWRGARPAGPVRSVTLRVVDDMAYGAGLWEQAVRCRDGRALLPDLTEWPGGRSAVEPSTVPKL